MSDREIRAETEVPGTPEQVCQAIVTGPGITSWFMPAQFDERHEELEVPGAAPEQPIATEWLVEAKAGGTCVVRVVMSGAARQRWLGEQLARA
jgi:hypothetical protein